MMPIFYKIHRYTSLFCAVFFILLCVTGLILLFRMDIADANRTTPMMKEASIAHSQAWNALEEGQKAVEAANPGKSVRAVFAVPKDGSLVYRIQDKNSHARVATMMRMGGERVAYYPATGMMMKNNYGSDQKYTWVPEVIRYLHIFHTRLVNTNWGTGALAFVCTVSLLSLLSGYFIYKPSMGRDGFGKVHEFPRGRMWMDIHKWLGITCGAWAVVLTVSGLSILYFASAYRGYVKDVQADAVSHFENTSEDAASLSMRDALIAVQQQFPGSFVLSSELPSRSMKAYTFYITPEREELVDFFGQPVFVSAGGDGKADIYTEAVPAAVRAGAFGVDLHIHNHNLPLLKYIWAFWTFLTTVMAVSAVIALWDRKFPSRQKRHPQGRRPVMKQKKPAVWTMPAVISVLTLLGLVLPLMGNAASWGAAAAFIAAAVLSFACWQRERKA